jgi:hypothetical protein
MDRRKLCPKLLRTLPLHPFTLLISALVALAAVAAPVFLRPAGHSQPLTESLGTAPELVRLPSVPSSTTRPSATDVAAAALPVSPRLPKTAQAHVPEHPPLVFPPSLSNETWGELLFANPSNSPLWTIELQRQESIQVAFRATRARVLLSYLVRLLRTASPTLWSVVPELHHATNARNLAVFTELALANVHNCKGIAHRHLGQYERAATEQHEALRILNALIYLNKAIGVPVHPPQGAPDLTHALSQTHRYLLDTYFDADDMHNYKKYVAIFLQQFPEYGQYKPLLADLVMISGRHDDFDLASRQLLHAIEDRFEANASDEVERCCHLAEHLYRLLYYSISWVPGKDELRKDDPRDFADTDGIGIGKETKYGMADRDEDVTTFFTLFFIQDLIRSVPPDQLAEAARLRGFASISELQKNVDLEGYVKQQLKEGNLEPIAKYLYILYIDSAFYDGKGRYLEGGLGTRGADSRRITFDEVAKELRDQGKGNDSGHSRRIIAQFRDAYRFVEACRLKRASR